MRNYIFFRAWPNQLAQKPAKGKRPAITASLYFQKALPYEKNYYLQIVGAKLLPKSHMGPKICIKKG